MRCPTLRPTFGPTFSLKKTLTRQEFVMLLLPQVSELCLKVTRRTPNNSSGIFTIRRTSAGGSSGQKPRLHHFSVTIGHEVCLLNPSIYPRGIPSWEGHKRCVTRVSLPARWSSWSDGKWWLYGDLDVDMMEICLGNMTRMKVETIEEPWTTNNLTTVLNEDISTPNITPTWYFIM